MTYTPLNVKGLGEETREHCAHYNPNQVMQLKEQNAK